MKTTPRNRTKVIVTVAMLSALAYVAVLICRIPVVLFLKYDPKDVIIAIGGLIYGPLASAAISIFVSFIEMFTISETGLWGFLMNVIQSCAFSCTAAIIYKKRRDIKGAVIGLISAWIITVGVMILWNYIVTPYYMSIDREAIVKLILPAFLPFNVIKGGLNAAITILLYKPVVTALRKARLLEVPEVATDGGKKPKIYVWIILVAVVIIASCTLVILHLQNII